MPPRCAASRAAPLPSRWAPVRAGSLAGRAVLAVVPLPPLPPAAHLVYGIVHGGGLGQVAAAPHHRQHRLGRGQHHYPHVGQAEAPQPLAAILLCVDLKKAVRLGLADLQERGKAQAAM